MIFILVVENKICVIICIADMVKQIFTSVLENKICSKFKKPVPPSNEFNIEKGLFYKKKKLIEAPTYT